MHLVKDDKFFYKLQFQTNKYYNSIVCMFSFQHYVRKQQSVVAYTFVTCTNES